MEGVEGVKEERQRLNGVSPDAKYRIVRARSRSAGMLIWMQCAKARDCEWDGAKHLVAEAKYDRQRVKEDDFLARRGSS